jgi:curli biogenesis system outer membrane secretion channel CsgG
MRKIFIFVSLVVCILCSGCGTLVVSRVRPLSDDYIKQVIAVTSFENRSGFSGQWKIGSGMADMLVSELVSSGNFVVVERKFLDNVVGELERQNEHFFRKEGKVQKGRLKNAKYLVRGVITDFSQVGGGGLFFGVKNLLLGGRGHKARVALALTIVDVESGEVVNSVQCAGTARAREAYVKAKYKGVAFGGDAYFKTPLGVATCNALRRGIRGMIATIPKLEWLPMVAQVVDGQNIIVNGGEDRDIRKGEVYIIKGASKPVHDPVTGDVIKLLPGREIAMVRITSVDDTISRAVVVEGAASGLKPGMVMEASVK